MSFHECNQMARWKVGCSRFHPRSIPTRTYRLHLPRATETPNPPSSGEGYPSLDGHGTGVHESDSVGHTGPQSVSAEAADSAGYSALLGEVAVGPVAGSSVVAYLGVE